MAAIDDKRKQLQRLYCELVEVDGATIVHQMLSRALIAHKRETKKPAPKPRNLRRSSVRNAGASEITWKGRTLILGEAMRCCTAKQQLFVLHYVHDSQSISAAAKAVGYSQGGVKCHAASMRAAIAEERLRAGAVPTGR